MTDPVLGLVTAGPLCRADMVGGLAGGHGVTDGHQALISHPACVSGGELSVCSIWCVYLHAACQMSGICLKTLPEIPEKCSHGFLNTVNGFRSAETLYLCETAPHAT